jgi:hypothetical protein
MIQKILALLLPLLFLTHSAHAQFDDLKFKQALKLKKDFYVSDVSITGGDRNSSDFSISNVRIANNPAGYDRIVVDLSGNQNGKKSKLDRPPFYLVQVDSEHKRLLVTLYGKPKLDFSTQTAIQSVKKAKFISEIEFTPITEQDRWTWGIHTKSTAKAEIFELTEPARIIIDVKQ